MAKATTETKTKITLELSEEEAATLGAVLVAASWNGEYGERLQAIHDALESEDVIDYDVQVSWSDGEIVVE